MKSRMLSVFLSSILFLTVFPILQVHAQQTAQKSATPSSNWKAVDDAMGRAGQDQPDGAHKFSMPRSDLKVTLDGVELKAGFALGSWAAFEKIGTQSEVMGDLVLTEAEVAPVMQKLTESGIEITALHNHLIRTTPPVMYMHIDGHGDAARLATAIHDALALTKTPASAPAGNPNADLGFDAKQVDNLLGHAGKNNNGVYQFSVPRAEKIMENGMTVPNSMGIATALNFQPTGSGKAAITGDFVLTGKEVNPAIKALRQNGIAVTALHSHMLEEQPRLFFMHFWANDDATKLAKGLRAALDQTNSAKEK
jgi:biotin operon repressor